MKANYRIQEEAQARLGGMVVLHNGEAFLVDSVDLEAGKVNGTLLRESGLKETTVALASLDISPIPAGYVYLGKLDGQHHGTIFHNVDATRQYQQGTRIREMDVRESWRLVKYPLRREYPTPLEAYNQLRSHPGGIPFSRFFCLHRSNSSKTRVYYKHQHEIGYAESVGDVVHLHISPEFSYLLKKLEGCGHVCHITTGK